jgi:hypothetical protein
MDWAAEGVPVQQPLVKDVEAGIDRVVELFRTQRLCIFNTCRGLRDELGTYRRELGKDGQVTERIKDKENFHRLDGLRYVLGSIHGVGAIGFMV